MNIIDNLSKAPHKLFLIDGLGALLSASMLGGILVRFNDLVGMPTSILFFLAFFPIIYVVYDVYCYQTITSNLVQKIKGIVSLNILYCCISIVAVFWYKENLTTIGHFYFIAEILIIIVLIGVELKAVKLLKQIE